MYWIDADSGKIISKELNQEVEERIVYSDKTKKAIAKVDRIIAMHTHPSSLPPSIADFNSAYSRGYETSLVLCHDGKIYKYSSNEIISEKLYDLQIAEFIESGYDEKIAQIKTLRKLSENHAIRFEEIE